MHKILNHLTSEIRQLKEAGLYKHEYPITTSQSTHIGVESGKQVLNFCANNYLGLANHPELIKAGQEALAEHGFGLAHVQPSVTGG